MSEALLSKKIMKKNSDCVILRDYDKCYGVYNFYLFSTEGRLILVVTDSTCKQIPSVIEEEFENFSLKEERGKEAFKAWLEHEGYKE